MTESKPTNQRIAEVLDDLVGELRELREQQRKLAEEVHKLVGTSSS